MYEKDDLMLICPEQLVDKRIPHLHVEAISKLPSFHSPELNSSFKYSTELQSILSGRRLLLDDIPFQINILQEHYENGYAKYSKGITNKNNQYSCVRCGNEEQRLFASFLCARCEKQCVYCRHCLMLGRVSQCTPLVHWIGPLVEYNPLDNPLQWKGTLSKGQEQASKHIVNAIDNESELLVWAVCGAGKTEVLFEGINYALKNGKRVCIATPRTDVVKELTPRLKQAFPRVEVSSLYGGSEDKSAQGKLLISTTHQLLRLYQTFDVLIIDEVDAFPYSADRSLVFAVNQAKKEHASIIYLTATPSIEMQNRITKKDLPVVKIPRRYHGYNLPVPTFEWCGNWQKKLKKNKLPLVIDLWIKERVEINKQLFIFVPTVDMLEQVTNLIEKITSRVDGVHAEDPNRHEKVEKFRNGETLVLVTTTILERGVTVANIDVAVFGSDEPVFTESALVQMAGRVGRSASFPSGDVRFFHFGKTKAMIAAKNHIEAMNKEEGKQ